MHFLLLKTPFFYIPVYTRFPEDRNIDGSGGWIAMEEVTKKQVWEKQPPQKGTWSEKNLWEGEEEATKGWALF